MSTAARKARKRAGIPLIKPPKKPTRAYDMNERRGLGLITGPEILASLLIRGVA